MVTTHFDSKAYCQLQLVSSESERIFVNNGMNNFLNLEFKELRE